MPSTAGERCPVQGCMATDVRNCNPIICLNPSANKPHLTFLGSKSAKSTMFVRAVEGTLFLCLLASPSPRGDLQITLGILTF